ncbi:hypothetical protein CONPUDRAFT_140241 [Coniophora puteana RWD-64-598 SS2]|uniref:Golgi apparatus membrane protein TVP38 n=1 Tax=Coniophora puteana (strain RWD-64-598) TaxID=741705 RepID=A0A5M3M7M2_CONPW|nr:uncharacterized protein CONPUDRAFT_140241 [Coniophora puteana RWD-64-598 SS2]EIW74770.1 hypothetical protein CONPUDRAFT_140241 [Coniophora puteana RWD-64-598 SS2]
MSIGRRSISMEATEMASSRTEEIDARAAARTPSPTPSERQAITPSRSLQDRLKHPSRTEFGLLAGIIIAAPIIALISVYRSPISCAVQHLGKWFHDLRGGWAILFCAAIVLSCPPFLGQEVVGILCGMAFKSGTGFLIVCVGEFVGETIVYATVRWLLKRSAARYEAKSLDFAALCALIREAGFGAIVIARLSPIPPNYMTAAMASCSTPILQYLLAFLLSLPKQFPPVYLGASTQDYCKNPNSNVDSAVNAVLGVALAIAMLLSLIYTRRLMNSKLPEVVYERRKRRCIYTWDYVIMDITTEL